MRAPACRTAAPGEAIPQGIAARQSTVLTCASSGQPWWGVILETASGACLQDGYNYRFRGYLHCDRAMLVDDAVCGVWALDAPADAAGPGWALYVNGDRIAAEARAWAGPLPGTGSTAQGVALGIPLRAGANCIELLLSIPVRAAAPSGAVVWAMRPNLFAFRPAGAYGMAATGQDVPAVAEYPLWADGAPMQRVSEFVLRHDTAPWNRDRWAWRIDPASGATHVLLNHDPTATVTIDGFAQGSAPSLMLACSRASGARDAVWVRLDLAMEPWAQAPPTVTALPVTLAPA